MHDSTPLLVWIRAVDADHRVVAAICPHISLKERDMPRNRRDAASAADLPLEA